MSPRPSSPRPTPLTVSGLVAAAFLALVFPPATEAGATLAA